jgi:hypothetical protein
MQVIISVSLCLILISYCSASSSSSRQNFSVIDLHHNKYQLLNDVEFLYQFPVKNPLTNDYHQPRGLLFLAHGCSHSATDWFPRSMNCTKCLGLPVEQTIVKEALNQKLIVLVITSVNRFNKCWSYSDVNRVAMVINHMYNTVIPSTTSGTISTTLSLPLFLLGASSVGTSCCYC